MWNKTDRDKFGGVVSRGARALHESAGHITIVRHPRFTHWQSPGRSELRGILQRILHADKIQFWYRSNVEFARLLPGFTKWGVKLYGLGFGTLMSPETLAVRDDGGARECLTQALVALWLVVRDGDCSSRNISRASLPTVPRLRQLPSDSGSRLSNHSGAVVTQ